MRICKNKITDTIAEHFGANALKLPESRIQPMCLLEIDNNKLHFLGEFKYVVKGGFGFPINIKYGTVPNVDNIKTKNVAIDFGFKILENFLKAFKMDPAVVSAAIKGSKKMSFSFSNVQRKYIDLLQLGNIISENDICGDSENISITRIMENEKLKLGLITDALISNNFSLNTYKENETDAEIDIPLLEGYVANANLDLKIQSASSNEVKFEGKAPLTFAFSCVELKIENNGKFSRGDWLKNIRSAKGVRQIKESELTSKDWNKYSKMMIDDNMANPLLLEL